MIDREQMWEIAAKEIAGERVGAADLSRLDRKLNLGDKLKQRSPEYSGTPTSRLQDKERKLFRFVVEVMAQKALG